MRYVCSLLRKEKPSQKGIEHLSSLDTDKTGLALFGRVMPGGARQESM